MMDVTRAAKLFAAIEDVRREATRESQEFAHRTPSIAMACLCKTTAALNAQSKPEGSAARSLTARGFAIAIAVAAVRYAAECTDYSPPIGVGEDVQQ